MRVSFGFVLAVFLLVFVSCGQPNRSGNTVITTDTRIPVPDFDADSAFYFVERQMAFGPRVPGTRAHAECARWIEQTVSRFADEVIVQRFTARIWNGDLKNGVNIIASFYPERQQRILLGAHWDSRAVADHDPDPANWHKPTPGANDGGSCAGVLLEIARQLSINRPNIGIDLIFFDLEDQGTPHFEQRSLRDEYTWALGAQHWAHNPHRPNYRANYGILICMVGASNPRFGREGFSMQYAPDVMERVWRTARGMGFGHAFVNEPSGHIINDHLFVNRYAGIPMINIIDHCLRRPTGFFTQWHTIHDDMSIIDRNTLRMVGQVVLAHIYQYQ